MPALNYSQPLYNFDNGATSYTAVKDCYLLGSMCGSMLGSAWKGIVSINGTAVYTLAGSGSTNVASSNSITIPLTKIKTGDTVSISLTSVPNIYMSLHIFEEL